MSQPEGPILASWRSLDGLTRPVALYDTLFQLIAYIGDRVLMTADDSQRRPRGRPPRAEPALPSGYRLTEARRREINVARGFFDYSSTQQFIDDAVKTFLRGLRQSDARYAAAVDALGDKLGDECASKH
jgi:hypothetical protein